MEISINEKFTSFPELWVMKWEIVYFPVKLPFLSYSKIFLLVVAISAFAEDIQTTVLHILPPKGVATPLREFTVVLEKQPAIGKPETKELATFATPKAINS